jgi:UV DNA damage repair endonuclease
LRLMSRTNLSSCQIASAFNVSYNIVLYRFSA